MCKKADLASRVRKAKAAARFAIVINRDGKGRVRNVHLPGTDGKLRMVLLQRHRVRGDPVTEWGLSTTCNAVVERGDVVGYVPCPGNSYATVCYSSMAAILVALDRAGYDVSFCATARDAMRLSRLGGDVVKVWSRQQRKYTDFIYAVVKASPSRSLSKEE